MNAIDFLIHTKNLVLVLVLVVLGYSFLVEHIQWPRASLTSKPYNF